MSYPKTIFIDTNIFDGSQYNFSSASFSAFRDVVKDKGFILLLPDPTLKEIERHIEDKTKSALQALEVAQRKNPFLTKLSNWLLQNKDKTKPKLFKDIMKNVYEELNGFLSLFKVEKLVYDNIKISEIMSWYDNKEPPFGEGKKRKEFPDAFTIAILRNYSQSKNKNIAVISGDSDFEKACSSYKTLLYFKSLSSFTEAIIAEEKKADAIRELLKKDESKIAKAIKESFIGLTFIIDANWEADIQDIEADKVDFKSLNLVGIGKNGFTLVFKAVVHYSAYVYYENLETAIYDSEDKVLIPWEEIEGTVQDANFVEGIIKAEMSKDKKSIENIHTVEFDKDYIYIESIPEEEYY